MVACLFRADLTNCLPDLGGGLKFPFGNQDAQGSFIGEPLFLFKTATCTKYKYSRVISKQQRNCRQTPTPCHGVTTKYFTTIRGASDKTKMPCSCSRCPVQRKQLGSGSHTLFLSYYWQQLPLLYTKISQKKKDGNENALPTLSKRGQLHQGNPMHPKYHSKSHLYSNFW